MTEKTVITILAEKYSELLRDLKESQWEAERLGEALIHLEATMRLFNSNFDVSAIKPRRDHRQRIPWLGQGKYTQTAYDVLRTAEKPLTSQEIARRVMELHRIPTDNIKDVRAIANTIHVSLYHHKQGVVVAVADRRPIRWKIVENKL